MLTLFRLFIGFCVIFLLACQPKNPLNSERPLQEKKQIEAANYNTQLGLAYLKQGDRPRAKRKLLAALDSAPQSAAVNAAMAYYLEATGDVKEAAIFYKNALSAAPNSGAQLNNYGAFLCRKGQYKEAEAYFLAAVKDVRYLNTAGAYENAGLCAAAIPDYLKAKRYFTKALNHDPGRKPSLQELAQLELRQGHANNTLKYLQQFPAISLYDPVLLTIGIEAAHKTGNTELEAAYKLRLTKLNYITDYTGAKNEYDNNNG